MKTLLTVVIICFLFFSQAFGQQSSNAGLDSICRKINFYGQRKSNDLLFVHFDKNIYVNNENIWFTAYLLNLRIGEKLPDVFYVALVDELNHLVLKKSYVMENGIGSGNIFLADTISPGHYKIIVYTNKSINGVVPAVFSQSILIKASQQYGINASLKFADSVINYNEKSTKLSLKLTRENQPVGKIDFKYKLSSESKPVSTGNGKTDELGEFSLFVPLQTLDRGDILDAEVTIAKESKHLHVRIPKQKSSWSVRFYPEGGNLVNSLISYVGWEVKSTENRTQKISGVLYDNGKSIDTISTDVYGMGKFRFAPLQGHKYYVKLLGSVFPDSAYSLPTILNKGMGIVLLNALTDDTVKFSLFSNVTSKAYVLIHNYKQDFFSLPIELNNAGRKVKVDLSTLPKGLASITLLDSNFRPVAERLFFAHYQNKNNPTIHTDKEKYAQRQLVHLTLKLNAFLGQQHEGIVSVACVQDNRLNLSTLSDIESYFYLINELGYVLGKENFSNHAEQERAYLEEAILIKGWSRYKWQEMLQTKAKDTIRMQNSLLISGNITHFGRPLKESAAISLVNSSGINQVISDDRGNFRIPNSYLFAIGDKKLPYFLNAESPGDYQITFIDSSKHIADSLAALPDAIYNSRVSTDTNSLVLKGFDHVTYLKEVIVKGRGNSDGGRVNACGDYVCKYNILNCQNHRSSPENKAPNKHDHYFIWDHENNKFVSTLYEGCTVPKGKHNLIDGIYYSQEFYGSNYTVVNPPEPEFISTLYWNSLCKINSKNEVELTFYTSDLTGNFKIIVEGVSLTDVIYASKEIIIRKQ